MILVKFHEDVVALCDSDLIGKEFEEGDRYLKVSEVFFKGEEISEDDLRKIFKGVDNLNIVGKEVVDFALKEGFINEEDVILIQGVPHVQVYRF
jgi:uncharacterized protein